MERRNIYQPFTLELLETQHYMSQPRTNTFFELVFVLGGEGIQVINNHRLPYTQDKLFLLSPQDKHSFEVTAASTFFFIRFTDNYLKTQRRELVHKLEFMFCNHNHLPGCVLRTFTDKPLVRALVEALVREHINPQPQHQEVVTQLIDTIITLTARNMLLMPPTPPANPHSDEALQLLTYIHQHIYDPDQLKADKIAAQLNVSPSYISEYFKKRTGEGLQEYITRYKLKIIETRLRYTNMTISEIVYELGFTDASHLNKVFKKYKGLSPRDYKRTVR